ncbi:MAG: hypothetical protein JO356_18450 [Acidobacteria bacterium]|nr:hypothetical protein [Acidobacteriota bacterium]
MHTAETIKTIPPSYHEIVFDQPEGLVAKVALERLASSVTLTDCEAGVYEAGGRRFEQVVRFATVIASRQAGISS